MLGEPRRPATSPPSGTPRPSRSPRRPWPSARSVGDPLTEANALDELGQALYGLGAYAEAIAHFQSALEAYRAIGHPYEAAALHHLGRAHLAAGHPGRARETWRRALARATELGDPLATEVRAELAALR